MSGNVRRFFAFIRFSHTVFAMPFALGAMFVAANGFPPLRILVLAILAMVFARTAAMTFNRIADWDFDKSNPRTTGRQTLVSRKSAVIACGFCTIAFLGISALINPLCGMLSPVAIFIVFFYSLTKRFTHFAQFYLGFALAVAPVGGWLAVTGSFAFPPLILAAAVLFWVAGFDIIYATQDYDVDRQEGLKSMVVWLGIPRALNAALLLHAVALGGFAAFGWSAGLGIIYHLSLIAMLAAIIFEHIQARKSDIAAINRAFFHANAAIGGIFAISTLLDRLSFN